MKAKLIVEGKEFDIEILDPKLQELIAPKKKTGYERVKQGKEFVFQHSDGSVSAGYDHHNGNCNNYFDSANYYSDVTVAENNARADKLMRQLRRFKVENNELNPWKSYMICYNHRTCRLCVVCADDTNEFYACQYFGSEDTAKNAIDTFHDELVWYFTEYKDSL